MKGKRMYMNTSELNPSNSINPFSYLVALRRPPPPKRPSIRLNRRRRRGLSKEAREKARVGVVLLKREMEIKNLKLYMENQSIIKENEKLRKKALLLHQENKVLLSQLQKVSHPTPGPTPWLSSHLAHKKSQQQL